MEPRNARRAHFEDRRGVAPIGLRILIPGYFHWSWDQRERGLILFGSYAAALLVGVFTWGSGLGLLVLAFAFATHAFSTANAIGQFAFPGFGRMIPALSASAGLGFACYAPALVLASVYAWPISPDDRPRDGFLVNRWAYREASPRMGETVWLRPSRGVRPRVGRVLAHPGQEVEWLGNQLRVDGQVATTPLTPSHDFKLTVPEGHLLLAFGEDLDRGPGRPAGWEIVARSDVQGRAWARSYPFWDRRFLN